LVKTKEVNPNIDCKQEDKKKAWNSSEETQKENKTNTNVCRSTENKQDKTDDDQKESNLNKDDTNKKVEDENKNNDKTKVSKKFTLKNITETIGNDRNGEKLKTNAEEIAKGEIEKNRFKNKKNKKMKTILNEQALRNINFKLEKRRKK